MATDWEEQLVSILREPEAASNRELAWVWSSALHAGNVFVLERLAQVQREGLELERLPRAADLLAQHQRDESLFALCSRHPEVLRDVSRSRTLPVLLRYCSGSRAIGPESLSALSTLERIVMIISENTLALAEIPQETWTACMVDAVDAKASGALELLRKAPVKRLHDPMFLAELVLRAFRQRHQRMGKMSSDQAVTNEGLMLERKLVQALVAPSPQARAQQEIGSLTAESKQSLGTPDETASMSKESFLSLVLEALACIFCPVPPEMLHWFIELHLDAAADWLFSNCEFDPKTLPYTQFTATARDWLWQKGIHSQTPAIIDGIIRALVEIQEQSDVVTEGSLERLVLLDSLDLAADLLAQAGCDVSLLTLYQAVYKQSSAQRTILEKRVAGETLLRLFEVALVSRALPLVHAICAEICERLAIEQGPLSINKERLRLACVQALRWAAFHDLPEALAMIRSFPLDAAHDPRLLGSLCCEVFLRAHSKETNDKSDQTSTQKEHVAARIVHELVQAPSRCLARESSSLSKTRFVTNDGAFDNGLLESLETYPIDQVALLHWSANHAILRLARLLLSNQQTALLQCAERGEPHLLRILLTIERQQEPYQKIPLLWPLMLEEALCRVIPTRDLTSVHLLIEQPSGSVDANEHTSIQILATLGDAAAFQLLHTAAEQGDDTLVRLLLLAQKERMVSESELSVIVANAARVGQFPTLFTLHRLLREMSFTMNLDERPMDQHELGMRLFGKLSEADLRELARLAAVHGEFAVFETAIGLFFREFAIDPSRRYELLVDLLRVAVHHGQAPLVEFICLNYPGVLHHAPEVCVGQNTVLIYHNRMEERLSRDTAAALLAALLNSRPPAMSSSKWDLATQTLKNAGGGTAERDRQAKPSDPGTMQHSPERPRAKQGGNQQAAATSAKMTPTAETYSNPAAFFPKSQPSLLVEHPATPARDEGMPFVRITTSTVGGSASSPVRVAASEEAAARPTRDTSVASIADNRGARASLSRQRPRDSTNDALAPTYLLRGLNSIPHPMLLQLLNWSVRERYATLLQLLLQLGLAISRDNLNELLLCAVDGNDLNTMDAFLEAVTRSLRSAGVSTVLLDPEAHILTRALVLGNIEMALRLLRLSASLAVYRRKLSLAERAQLLLLAAAQGHAELTKITLHTLGVDVNVTDKDGLTPLQLALRPLRQETTAKVPADQERLIHGQRAQVVIELILQGAGLEVLDETDLLNVFRLVSHTDESFMFVLTRFTELPDELGRVRRVVRGDTGLRILRETIAMLQPTVELAAPLERARLVPEQEAIRDIKWSTVSRTATRSVSRSLFGAKATSIEPCARGAYAVARFLAMYEDSLLHRIEEAERWQFLFAAVAAGDRAAVQKLRVCFFPDAFDPTSWRDIHGRTLLDVAATLPDPYVAEAVMVALTEQLGATPFVEIYVESNEAGIPSPGPMWMDPASAGASSSTVMPSDIAATERMPPRGANTSRVQAEPKAVASVEASSRLASTSIMDGTVHLGAGEVSAPPPADPTTEHSRAVIINTADVEQSSPVHPHRSIFSDSDWDSDLDATRQPEDRSLTRQITDDHRTDHTTPLETSTAAAASKGTIFLAGEASSVPRSPLSLAESDSQSLHRPVAVTEHPTASPGASTPAPAPISNSPSAQVVRTNLDSRQLSPDSGVLASAHSVSTISQRAEQNTVVSEGTGEAGHVPSGPSTTTATYVVHELPKRVPSTRPRPLPPAISERRLSTELKAPSQGPEMGRVTLALASPDSEREMSSSQRRQQRRRRRGYLCCGLPI